MALNMKSLTQALAKTAAVIEKTVTTTVQEVTGPRPLQDYDLLSQVGSGGPGLVWKLYSAKPRPSAPSTQYPIVCVWVLDKRELSEARAKAGLSRTAEESFLEIVRADAAKLVRLRHPGVVHVVQALDESKNALAMVTEPLFASVSNALGNLENVEKVPKELKGMEMSLLEVKHGLLQLAETLDFLHNNARLIHQAISPETVFITLSGSWKLGGFGFAVSADQMSTIQPFHYAVYDIEDSVLPLQPPLNYTAPELVRSRELSLKWSSDMFSFGCMAYHLVARKPLLDCKNNVKMYMNTLTYLTNESFSNIPSDLLSDLRQLLSMDEASRPSALDFTGSSFFRDDTRLRALRFLDHMLERDNMQKTEFLKALSDMWKDFDSRVLRCKVLPPLCAELRNMVMQPMILPMVLTIAESQDKNEFELSTLPALVPVLSSASGETLLLLVKHAEMIINKVSNDHLIANVLPLLVRAYDDNDARIQEEVLQRTVPLAKQLDMQLVKQVILPRVHSLALRTTVAAVRVNALRCLSDMVPSLGKHEILDVLQILQRCTAVDRSAPTLMCTLVVGNSITKKHGIEFAAEHVVPLLFPLLTSQQLNVQQLAKYMLFIKDILRKIEEKRGITVTQPEESQGRFFSYISNGIQSEYNPKTITPAKSSSSWDEDWGSVKKEVAKSSPSPDPNLSSMETFVSYQTPINIIPSQPSVSALDNQTKTCPAVDIEWPSQNPSGGFGSQRSEFGDIEKQYKSSGGGPNRAFEDIDPFANWPPRPANSDVTTFDVNPILTPGFSGLNLSNSGSLSNKNPIATSSQHQENSTSISRSNDRGLNAHYPLAYPRMSSSSVGNSMTVSGTGSMKSNFSQHNGNKDLESIFASGSSEQTSLRITPPPAAASGRVGRNHGRLRPPPRSQSSHNNKAPNEQANLLDLL